MSPRQRKNIIDRIDLAETKLLAALEEITGLRKDLNASGTDSIATTSVPTSRKGLSMVVSKTIKQNRMRTFYGSKNAKAI